MVKLFDNSHILEISMALFDGSNLSQDWSGDFFGVGNLEYNEELDAYKVNDIDYCIKQAEDWESFNGDYKYDIEINGERVINYDFWER